MKFFFFLEVIEKLGSSSIIIGNLQHDNLTNENAIHFLQQHEKFHIFYANQIEYEIEYISSHFYELCEPFFEELKTLSIDTIEKIVSNQRIKLKSEDQLLEFINRLYKESFEYSILYDHVLFYHVENDTIGEFIDQFNRDDMSEETWRHLSNRLRQTITNCQEVQPGRYAEKQFFPKGHKNFDGILKYLLTTSNGNIREKVDITASSEKLSTNRSTIQMKFLPKSKNQRRFWMNRFQQVPFHFFKLCPNHSNVKVSCCLSILAKILKNESLYETAPTRFWPKF